MIKIEQRQLFDHSIFRYRTSYLDLTEKNKIKMYNEQMS